MTFVDKDGERHSFQVAKGDNLLDIAQANDIEMEGQLHLPQPPPHFQLTPDTLQALVADPAPARHAMLLSKNQICMIRCRSRTMTRTIC